MPPFSRLAASLPRRSPLREAITAARRAPEPDCVSSLLAAATAPRDEAERTAALARRLAGGLRQGPGAVTRENMVQGLLQEFSLSSDEGVALMCLAEALLRIPDAPTRDALIRDKIGRGDWRAHVGRSDSPFVNAAAWGLLVTGRLVSTHDEGGLAHALTRVTARFGEPMIRRAVDLGMRLMGRQFVCGETIGEALAHAGRFEAQGFRYSYDMLGEAALTQADALRYMASYENALEAIGAASKGRGAIGGPGLSIKLSALHPRYAFAKRDRMMDELYPRLLGLVARAREMDVGINLDAEEADRLEPSLDLLERLCAEPVLEGWNGIGFVVQAYQKRCPFVIDFVIDLARRTRHRLMVRLVKGAYWDSEIKRAQVEGVDDYPVYTRKVHTDVSYLACARRLLAAPDAVFPQFATHNAQSLAAIYHMAGDWHPQRYEFQCLHGMGEPLYAQVVGPEAEGKLDRPCRIYAPVGTHETLLAYLVRRLLENGANTSFINRIADPRVALDDLVADPAQAVRAASRESGIVGLPHARIPKPPQLYGEDRPNARGIDLTDESVLHELLHLLPVKAAWKAAPTRAMHAQPAHLVVNPADPNDVVGSVVNATFEDVDAALEAAQAAAPSWGAMEASLRAASLRRAADQLEAQMPRLLGLIVREAGKTLANAVGEVREAVDFLRYYASEAARALTAGSHPPLGVVLCVSPWNFPLAIFTGQVSGALAAGNVVIAKPAEQTPLVAAEAVRILHAAGIPEDVLQLVPGEGETVGARLVADARVQGVVFTGSTDVARNIQRTLAERLDARGRPVTLVAETGGQNAMIVDSSALTEQAVGDAIASAFDSAGQRCSALRLLCVQDEAYERLVGMLKGAMLELQVGDPQDLATDVGPVIDAPARDAILAHVEAMRAAGLAVTQADGPAEARGTFVPPTVVELDRVDRLAREVFGPVLHVVRFRREDLDGLIERINALGYGLTLGIHSRVDHQIAAVVGRARVGNVYVNRNIVGAVVGVQPFGGEGLSGTGPKAGGPLYLNRMLASYPPGAALDALRALDATAAPRAPSPAFRALAQYAPKGSALAGLCTRLASLAPSGAPIELTGPTGERNAYQVSPRERVLCLAEAEDDLLAQLALALAAGATAVWPAGGTASSLRGRLPEPVREAIVEVRDWLGDAARYDVVLHHGREDERRAFACRLAQRRGPLVALVSFEPGEAPWALERLLLERVVSVNTAAAGGNASLMTLG